MNQFPQTNNDSFLIKPRDIDCEKQKNKFPEFVTKNKEWLSRFTQFYNDSEFVAWPVEQVKLTGNQNALILGIGDTRYDEGPPEFWLSTYDAHGDSIQHLRLNPFLYEEAHNLEILYRKEKFITLYQNLGANNFLRMTWQLSDSDNLYRSVQILYTWTSLNLFILL